jgi:hypothetical protein
MTSDQVVQLVVLGDGFTDELLGVVLDDWSLAQDVERIGASDVGGIENLDGRHPCGAPRHL